MNIPNDTPPGSTVPTDADILITRIIDGEATPEDWAAFKALAARQPEVWRDLAECQQDHADLSAAVSAAWRIADSIDLPVEEARSAQLSRRVRGAMTWGGWAMAAAVALAFTTQRPNGTGSEEGLTAGPALGPGVIPVSTSDQAYDAYLELGRQDNRVLEEVPTRILVETRALEDGTVEVRYLRQILERVTVPSLYEFGQDEAGRPVPIRVRGRVVEAPL
jgi:hypothetical protein